MGWQPKRWWTSATDTRAGRGPTRVSNQSSLKSITLRDSRQGHSDCLSAHVNAPISEDHLQANNADLRGSMSVAAREATAPSLPRPVHWMRPQVAPCLIVHGGPLPSKFLAVASSDSSATPAIGDGKWPRAQASKPPVFSISRSRI